MNQFITPENFADTQVQHMEPPRGKIIIASCEAEADMAGKCVKRYQELHDKCGSNEHMLYLENILSSAGP
jgi:hypothetical protein